MKKFLSGALVLGAVLLSADSAEAQLRDVKMLTLDAAKTMADAAEAEADANGWSVVIAIVDDAGDLVLLRRSDAVQRGSIDIAIAKARTAARLRRDTKALADAVAGGRTEILSADLMALEGGVAIVLDGQALGGIGASGVQSSQDAQIARAGLAALTP